MIFTLSTSGTQWWSTLEPEQQEFVATVARRPLRLTKQGTPQTCRSVFIRDLGDERVSLNSPIPVTIETSGNQVSVYSLDTGDFGVGVDEQSALDEFRASMADLYFMLKEESAALGPLPQKHWNFLRSVIDER
jgi:hypothetical protein